MAMTSGGLGLAEVARATLLALLALAIALPTRGKSNTDRAGAPEVGGHVVAGRVTAPRSWSSPSARTDSTLNGATLAATWVARSRLICSACRNGVRRVKAGVRRQLPRRSPSR